MERSNALKSQWKNRVALSLTFLATIGILAIIIPDARLLTNVDRTQLHVQHIIDQATFPESFHSTAQSHTKPPEANPRQASPKEASPREASPRLKEDLPPCSWSQLNRIIPEGKWRTKTPQEKATDFDPLCKFSKARYHCNNKYTTAAYYIFQHDEGALVQERCHVPTEQSAFETLASTNKALLICGDSHAFEMYNRLLCKFESHVEVVDVLYANKGKPTYARDGELPACHGSKHSYEMFYGSELTSSSLDDSTLLAGESPMRTPNLKQTRNCVYKVPGMTCARFKMPGQDGSDGFVACVYYGRPDPGDVVAKKCHEFAMQGVPFPYNSEARSSGDEENSKLTPRSFDAVLANQYVKLDVLMSAFKQTRTNRFEGKIVLVSRFENGFQSSIGLEDVNAGLESRNTKGKYPFATGASDSLEESWKTSLSTLAKEGGMSAELLNVAPILESRSKDAKATMYPISGIRKGSSDNKYEVCCESMAALHQKKCSCEPDFENTRTCKNTGLLGEPSTCGQDTHYCLPGPLSDVSRVIFSGMLATVP